MFGVVHVPGLGSLKKRLFCKSVEKSPKHLKSYDCFCSLEVSFGDPRAWSHKYKNNQIETSWPDHCWAQPPKPGGSGGREPPREPLNQFRKKRWTFRITSGCSTRTNPKPEPSMGFAASTNNFTQLAKTKLF